MNYEPEDFGITKYIWRINESGIKVLDCHQDVDLSNKKLKELPFQFGVVDEYFYCQYNQLTSLKGAPRECNIFDCHNNNLTSLKGAPKECEIFYCYNNPNLPDDENNYKKFMLKMRKLKLQKILESC